MSFFIKLKNIIISLLLIQVAVKREEAISREISKKIAEDKKINKKEKDERYS